MAAKKVKNEIKPQRGPSLLEAWMGYIYSGNDCAKGLAALVFLRDCLSKGILTNAAIWEAASDEIKNNLRAQFGVKEGNEEVLYSLNNALAYAKRAKNASSIKAITASIEEIKAEEAKRMSTLTPVVSFKYSKAVITFPNPKKK